MIWEMTLLRKNNLIIVNIWRGKERGQNSL